MSADDTYVIRYEPETNTQRPYAVLWRQNYWDWDCPTHDKDHRFATYAQANAYATKRNYEWPAEYGVVVEDNVPKEYLNDPSGTFHEWEWFDDEDRPLVLTLTTTDEGVILDVFDEQGEESLLTESMTVEEVIEWMRERDTQRARENN